MRDSKKDCPKKAKPPAGSSRKGSSRSLPRPSIGRGSATLRTMSRRMRKFL